MCVCFVCFVCVCMCVLCVLCVCFVCVCFVCAVCFMCGLCGLCMVCGLCVVVCGLLRLRAEQFRLNQAIDWFLHTYFIKSMFVLRRMIVLD